MRAYKGHDYVCYQLDGMIYWTMGGPVEKTVLINRTHVEAEIEDGGTAG